MTTFDRILPLVALVLRDFFPSLPEGSIFVNRDLNGRVRLVIRESLREDPPYRNLFSDLASRLKEELGPHAAPDESFLIFEKDMENARGGAPSFPLDGMETVLVVDRLVSETPWNLIAPESTGAPRIVFFSVKGGVGRSTALAVSAWSLAQSGKKVLVLDLDLESPGLSASLLPEDRRPQYGLVDWLVEDLVDNGNLVFDSMTATSLLSHDGEIYVVPAHGREPGEYVSKLGRIFMPKILPDGIRTCWSERLSRLIGSLEERWKPDVVLLDSRAGIDEVASACVTSLGANLVLLFAVGGDQTWSGYRILFDHWKRSGTIGQIRENMQVVAAMLPDVGTRESFEALREQSYGLFLPTYDEISPGEGRTDLWSFEETDETAPHYPWPILWNRGFSSLGSLHSRLESVDPREVGLVFGPLLDSLKTALQKEPSGNA